MRRWYSPIVIVGMGLHLVRQAATVALIVVLSYVTMQNWGPDLTPVTAFITEKLQQLVTS